MKIEWTTSPCVPVETLEANVRHSKALGLPYAASRADRPPLAVVGGGPSLPDHLEELRAWPGDIWACGSPYPWLRKRGIEAVFFNIDPLEETIDLARGAKRAVLSTTNHPGVFEVVESAEVFDIISREDLMNHGVTTATAAPHLAVTIGYRDITFFACESSFEKETHAYKHEDFEGIMGVTCGGEPFWTKPALAMQAELLASAIRLAPAVFKERGGGLLAAMVKHGIEYDVTHANKALHGMLAGHCRVWISRARERIQVDSSDVARYVANGWTPCEEFVTPNPADYFAPVEMEAAA